MNTMTLTIIFFIVAYFIGSIIPGYFIGKHYYHKDIRDEGSGNIGTTNAFRVLGMKAGILTMTLDVLKGTLAGALPGLMGFHEVNGMLVGLGAVLGHVFSIWLGFKGGKAVATAAGVLLAYNPLFFVLVAIVLIIGMSTTSIMSLSSLITFVFASIWSFTYHDYLLSVIAITLTVFVFYLHRANIARMAKGVEPLMPFGLNYWLHQKKHSK